MADLENLVLVISADVRQMQRSLKRLDTDINGATNRAVKNIKKIDTAFSQVSVGATRSVKQLLAAYASIEGAKQLVALVDQYQAIQNALKATGLEGSKLDAVYKTLFSSAQRNYQSVADLVTLYSRLSIASKQLGVNSTQISRFVDNVATALRASGTSADAARGALLQLSQALGNGTVRAEEFNSIAEGAPIILQQVAAGLIEAAGDVGKLRKIMLEGELSSKAFFAAFQAGAPEIAKRLANVNVTVSQSLQYLQNTLLDTVGKMDTAAGGSRQLAYAITQLSVAISQADFQPVVAGIAGIISSVELAYQWLVKFEGQLRSALGVAKEGDIIGLMAQRDLAEAARTSATGGLRSPIARGPLVGPIVNPALTGSGRSQSNITDTPPTRASGRSESNITAQEAPPKVSIKDFPSPPDPNASANAAKKAAAEAAARLKQINEVSQALTFETEQLGRTNEQQEIYSRLQQAGISDSHPRAAGIMAQASALYKLKEAQDAVNDAMKAGADLATSALDSLIIQGDSLNQVISQVLKNLASMILQASIAGTGPLAGIFGTASTTGGAGGAFGALVGAITGKASGGRTSKGQPYVVGEKRPELFVPDTAGRIVPRLPNSQAQQNSRTSVTQNNSTTINAPGADSAKLEEVKNAVIDLYKHKESVAVKAVSKRVRSRRSL